MQNSETDLSAGRHTFSFSRLHFISFFVDYLQNKSDKSTKQNCYHNTAFRNESRFKSLYFSSIAGLWSFAFWVYWSFSVSDGFSGFWFGGAFTHTTSIRWDIASRLSLMRKSNETIVIDVKKCNFYAALLDAETMRMFPELE